MTVGERKASRSARAARTHVGGMRNEPRRDESGHAHIARIQRARILAAMFEVVCERGAASVSVADVVERSGVSRRTFYELFEDREACFLAAFEDALSPAEDCVLAAYDLRRKWRERVRAGLLALLAFLDEQPTVGRLLICESLTAGPKALARRNEVLARLTRALDEGRSEPESNAPPPLTAEGLVGGVLSLLHARLTQEEHEPLLGLANPLVSMIVLPYLGHAAARRELERTVPSVATNSSAGPLLSDPFKEAGVRLTYRTVRVLLAIADLAGQGVGPSNRLVGESAGISDQGQISKLLGRLQRVGLISNSGLAPGQGSPNEWSLSARGREMTERIRTHTGLRHVRGQASAHTSVGPDVGEGIHAGMATDVEASRGGRRTRERTTSFQ